MTNDIFSVRHELQRVMTNADQTESQAILTGSAVADAGVYDEVLSGELEDLETGDEGGQHWSAQDVALDDEVGAVTNELQRRALLLKGAYPFSLTGGTLTYTPTNNKFYEYLLSICMTPSLTKKPFVQLPRSFERVVALLIQLHLGDNWQHLHTGHPREKANGTTFRQCILKLSEISAGGREWRWDPDPRYPPKPGIGGDGGLDFVIWRPSVDNRIGQLYVVGQCACGNDWPTKFNDLRVEPLEGWMRPVTEVPFIRCFSTPFMMSDGNFMAAHKEAGWTLDRARLALFAHEASLDPRVVALQPLFETMALLVTSAAA
ncbi:hypothetical protein [Sphingomonas nostoxanthinifaciens]|uniref:hypothetical protein n=1 Tax=Sphingomonas nostoxanthinifaciens TaxID=2872652 RepID=UPI001CC1C462|nr:hypothetical protein [Sphingomonas nostoxanthinifaciens]UAK24379.1 hypothetical protein K8P63_19040 [Sphingomonas nostoxanthinifaciens]